MGILARLFNIIRGNANAALDKAEDPAMQIELTLNDLRNDMATVKMETATVMADEKTAKRKLDECKEKIEEHTVAAKKALSAGNETDARRLLEKKKAQPDPKKQRRKGAVSSKVERKGSMELDIRGHACDEGVYEMERFIDGAVMSGIGTVTIIHGKGTGLLRKAIQQRLKSMKQVKSYRSGVYGEGEDGVTIVTLR